MGLRRRPARTRPIPGPPVEPTPLRPLPEPTGLRQGLSNALGFVRKRLAGDYSVDEFGFDPQLTDNVVMPPLKVVYDKWFRVEARGTENLPTDGGALVVSNHSGTLPVDSIMTAIAVHENTPNHRHLRMLGADLVFQIPVLGALARKTGQTLACTADA
ncbi:lysophospholipid acyltransferase family protein, partial [Kibdelosporangium lantanae]